MKPPFSYFGGKTLVADQIARHLPPHGHYVEPYCGSLAVLLAKPATAMETVNDLDRELVTFWRMLRDHPDDLARVCALTPHSRAEYSATFVDSTADDLEQARRAWVKLTQGRGRSLRNGNTGWRHYVDPAGSNVSMPGYLDGYVERMAAAAARLHHVSLECMPALDVIAKYGAEPDVLLYVDPPYLGDTRNKRPQYRHEMPAEGDHRQLAEALHSVKSAVVLSGYAGTLYDRDLYADWDRATIATNSGNALGDRARTEVLWSNRPLGAQLDLFSLGGVA